MRDRISMRIQGWRGERTQAASPPGGKQMRGSMNPLRCPDASMFEHANYIQTLQGYKV